MATKWKKIRRVLWWLFLAVFVTCGIWLGFYLYSTYTAQRAIAAMDAALAPFRTTASSAVQNAAKPVVDTAAVSLSFVTAQPAATPDPLLAAYQQYAEKNPDMAGWVYIDGTVVDYPVMFTPTEPQKYLHLDFNRRYSFSGLPFMDARCDPTALNQNQILYAHNMRSGQMFAELHRYLDASYLQLHPAFHFDTLTSRGEYQVVAVLQINLAGMKAPNMLCYSLFGTDTQQAVDTLNQYLAKYATLKVADVQVGDSVVTLSTCQHLGSVDRLVVMGRMARGTAAD